MTIGLDVQRLVQEHQVGLWRYLRYLGCSPVEAEDLCQETFVSVLRRPFVEQSAGATAAYLRTVARNLVLKSRRRTLRSVPLDDLEQAEDVWSRHAGDGGDGEDYVAALRACLERLSGRARQAMDLQYGQERSRADVGAALGLSEDGVKSLVRRSRETLRRCIEGKIGVAQERGARESGGEGGGAQQDRRMVE